MNQPIIRGPQQYTEGDETYEIRAYGGLHKIGNQVPYFSLTGLIRRPVTLSRVGQTWVDDSSGTIHRELIAVWPELAVLARLHLSDHNGMPMYAVENGWYWLQGFLSNQAMGVDNGYHGANGTGHNRKTPDECLRVFADLMRISWRDADIAAALVKDQILAKTTHYQRTYHKAAGPVGQRALTSWVEEQKPRWKAEAEAAIRDFDLKVY